MCLFYVYVYVPECGYTMCMQGLRRPVEGVGFLRTGLTGGCEFPIMGASNQTPVLCRSYWTVNYLSSPNIVLFKRKEHLVVYIHYKTIFIPLIDCSFSWKWSPLSIQHCTPGNNFRCKQCASLHPQRCHRQSVHKSQAESLWEKRRLLENYRISNLPLYQHTWQAVQEVLPNDHSSALSSSSIKTMGKCKLRKSTGRLREREGKASKTLSCAWRLRASLRSHTWVFRSEHQKQVWRPVCKSSTGTQEAEAGGSSIQGQFGVHNKTLSNSGGGGAHL